MADQELIEQVELADKVRHFLSRDPVGIHIAQRIEDEIKTAHEEFEQIDPNDLEKVRKIHYRIKVAKGIEGYLADAIIAGDNALATVDQMDQDEV